jgi:hypothetical protein
VVDTTMDALAWVRKQVEHADTDLLREMVRLRRRSSRSMRLRLRWSCFSSSVLEYSCCDTRVGESGVPVLMG